MDIEKLRKSLLENSDPDGPCIEDDLMQAAATALSPPNEPLTIEQLRAELEQVKRERDAAIEAANGLDKMIGRAWGED